MSISSLAVRAEPYDLNRHAGRFRGAAPARPGRELRRSRYGSDKGQAIRSPPPNNLVA